jgi:DNA-binding NtrC family response regulator
VRTIGRERKSFDSIPSLKSLHPAAAQWIGAMIRVSSAHPGMTKILDVVERLSDRPYRTNFVLVGEPGTGKEGLGRALAHLTCPGGSLVRYDVGGFPEEDALDLLCGTVRRPGLAEIADGGTIFIEELAGLGPKVQAALLRLLKSGRCERRGGMRPSELDGDGDDASGKRGKRLDVRVIASSDRDLTAEVAAGRLRHDLYYRLARVALWLPPLRERIEDIGPATIWTGNRVLRAAGLPLELVGATELEGLPLAERARAIVLLPEAVRRLEQHPWPGNFRELEVVLERALLLHRTGDSLGQPEIAAALD